MCAAAVAVDEQGAHRAAWRTTSTSCGKLCIAAATASINASFSGRRDRGLGEPFEVRFVVGEQHRPSSGNAGRTFAA